MSDLVAMTHAQRRYLQRGDGIEKRCAGIASRQLGLITREQLLAQGVSARAIDYRLAAGQLLRCFPCVYRFPGAPINWHQKLLAACLWADGVASHRSAAALWRCAGIKPGIPECTTTKSMHGVSGVVLHRSGALTPRDQGVLGVIPVTSPSRTLIDLASVVPEEDLELALDDALHRRVTTLARIETHVSEIETRGRKGLGALRRLLCELHDTPRVPSKFERLLGRVLTSRPLPGFTKEHPVEHEGRTVARIDFAYPAFRVGVEADSFKWHSSPDAFRRDRKRSNALTQHGWRIHRATWWDASERPNEVRAAVASLLGHKPFAI